MANDILQTRRAQVADYLDAFGIDAYINSDYVRCRLDVHYLYKGAWFTKYIPQESFFNGTLDYYVNSILNSCEVF